MFLLGVMGGLHGIGRYGQDFGQLRQGGFVVVIIVDFECHHNWNLAWNTQGVFVVGVLVLDVKGESAIDVGVGLHVAKGDGHGFPIWILILGVFDECDFFGGGDIVGCWVVGVVVAAVVVSEFGINDFGVSRRLGERMGKGSKNGRMSLEDGWRGECLCNSQKVGESDGSGESLDGCRHDQE